MSVTRIASRYAKSLVDLAGEQGKIERVLSDLQLFKEVAKNRDFSLMLQSPIIKSDKKQNIFNSIFSGKLDELTEAFFGIILRKGREGLLPAIAREFEVQYRAMKHISNVKLTTAKAMSADAIEALKAKILASDATDDNVELEVAVDENLIGGFVIEFDDKRYDSSVAHKLALLRKEFAQNQYTKEF